MPTPPPARYRVEHRQADRSAVLASLSAARPHHSLLAPFVSRLLHDGAAGTVALVDEATGAVAARRRVAPPAAPVTFEPTRGAGRPRRFPRRPA